jgi:hypothetical protein
LLAIVPVPIDDIERKYEEHFDDLTGFPGGIREAYNREVEARIQETIETIRRQIDPGSNPDPDSYPLLGGQVILTFESDFGKRIGARGGPYVVAFIRWNLDLYGRDDHVPGKCAEVFLFHCATIC